MPKIEQEFTTTNACSHTFKFIAPLEADRLKMLNSCTSCHTGETAEWANQALRTWTAFSPWRIAN